jgi:hypothetical protein
MPFLLRILAAVVVIHHVCALPLQLYTGSVSSPFSVRADEGMMNRHVSDQYSFLDVQDRKIRYSASSFSPSSRYVHHSFERLRGGRGGESEENRPEMHVKRKVDPQKTKTASRASLGPMIFVGWLYFMSVALAIPALPRLINNIMAGKDTVSSKSQMALASLLVRCFTVLLTLMQGEENK